MLTIKPLPPGPVWVGSAAIASLSPAISAPGFVWEPYLQTCNFPAGGRWSAAIAAPACVVSKPARPGH
jgi:hypothetical protein